MKWPNDWWLAAIASLVFVLGSCSKAPGSPPETGPSPSADDHVVISPSAEVAPSARGAREPDPALMTAVEAMSEAEIGPLAELDPLLDFVPADATQFTVIRDVDGLFTLVEVMIEPLGPVLRDLARVPGFERMREASEFVDGLGVFWSGLRGPSFALDRGMMLAEVDGRTVLVHGTDDPQAMSELDRSVSGGMLGESVTCKAVDGAPGYAVCADTSDALASYAPGKRADALRAKLLDRLDEPTVARSNVLGSFGREGADTPWVLGVVTQPGLLHVTMGGPDKGMRFRETFDSGPSPALGLVRPGDGFYWLRLDPRVMQGEGKPELGLPGLSSALTGELLISGRVEPFAIFGVAGIGEPGPIEGILTNPKFQQGFIDASRGGNFPFAVEVLSLGGRDATVFHGRFTPASEVGAELRALGVVADAWAFAASRYAIAAFAGRPLLDELAAYAGEGMGVEGLVTLPKPLAHALVANDVALVAHLPLDPLGEPEAGSVLEPLLARVPEEELPSTLTLAEIIDIVRTVASPYSSVSMWVGPLEPRLVLHASLQLIGDPRTEEGRAALAAAAKVRAGGEPAEAWGELLTRYPASTRRLAYETRAGSRKGSVSTLAGLLGMLALVPLFYE